MMSRLRASVLSAVTGLNLVRLCKKDDYTPLSGQVTILAGDTTATIDVSTLDDSWIEGTESVDVTLTGIAAGDPSIALGATTSASINLLDNDAASGLEMLEYYQWVQANMPGAPATV